MDEFLARLSNPLLDRIIQLIPDDEPVYLVGGAIRDALLRRPVYDLDFVIPGNAMKFARQIADKLGAAYYPLDKIRNMARLVFLTESDINGNERIARRIDFSTFQGADLIEDLKSRDFTMNAMAVEIHQLERLIDPLGGAADLASKRLKTCTPKSILDDPIRILRAVRFSVDLDLSMLPETRQYIREAVSLLPRESAERVRDELFRILSQSGTNTSLRILDMLGALEIILPEVCMLKNIEQSAPHIMDAWEHTLDFQRQLGSILDVLAAEFNPDKADNLTMGSVALYIGRFRKQLADHMSNALNPDRSHRGLLFLAGLYHDVGKPKTRTVDENGKSRFLDHERISGKISRTARESIEIK